MYIEKDNLMHSTNNEPEKRLIHYENLNCKEYITYFKVLCIYTQKKKKK